MSQLCAFASPFFSLDKCYGDFSPINLENCKKVLFQRSRQCAEGTMSVLSKCFLSFVSLAMSGSICTAQQACTLTHVTVQKLMDSDLRYQLIARFGPVRFCDPYCAGPC